MMGATPRNRTPLERHKNKNTFERKKQARMKTSLSIILIMTMTMFIVGIVSAGTTGSVVELTQKNSTDWTPVIGGATGTFTIGPERAIFAFEASGLENTTQYTLISYAEPYPGTGSKILRTAFSGSAGKFVASGTFSEDKLVFNTYASDAEGAYQDITGAKIWLVKTCDLVIDNGTAAFIAWKPDGYLFEAELIYPAPVCPITEPEIIYINTTEYVNVTEYVIVTEYINTTEYLPAEPTVANIGVFRPAAGQWYLDTDFTGTSLITRSFGKNGDVGVIGDWDGDGVDNIGVVRYGNTWILDKSGNGAFGAGDVIYVFGKTGDQYITGDWNADGADEIGVVRYGSQWILDYNGDGKYNAGDRMFVFGTSPDTKVIGTWVSPI